MEMLGHPHLMLAHIGRHHGILGAQTGNDIGNLLGRQGIAGLVILRLGLEGEHVLFPFFMVLLLQPFQQQL